MSLPLTLTLSASLLFSGCTLISQIIDDPINKPIEKPAEVNVQNSTTNPHGDSIIKDEYKDYELTITQDPNSLEGKYTLERGQISFAGARKDIIQSKLVIEQLGVNDFGYYYSVKVKGYPSNEYFGIFAKKDGKYVQKVISDNGEISYYDNIKLIHEDKRIKLTIKTNQGKRIIIWKKVDHIDDTKALEGAKKIYNEVCKANYCE